MSTGNSSKTAHPLRHLARSAGMIGLATLCSRVLGFIRDMVIARLFGVYVYAQAFVIAFRIPNLFRDLLAEGAANSAIVPVFSEYNARHSREEFWELANVVLNLLLVAASVITLLGIIFSPLLVRLIAPGFIADPQKLAATIKLNRIIFPYILLISLAAYSTAVLNSLKHFSIPAFAPCLLNISIIACALFFGEGTTGLATGVLAGGLLQLLIQIPVLYKKGFRPRLFRRFRHPAAFSIGKLMLPRLLSSSIYQLNNFVDSIFGSLAAIVGEGGVAVLYFSYRLIQFPLGIFSNALAQAALPTLSSQALEESRDKLGQTLSFSLRLTFLVMLPASVGLGVLAFPIVAAIFGGGKFDAHSARLTAEALCFYSIGLCAYGAVKILQSGFFALKDTLTPAKVSFVALISNIALNSLFMFPLKIGGIALATSISGIISFFMLFFILKKRLGDFPVAEIAGSFIRILLASCAMGLVCFIIAGKAASLHKLLQLAVEIPAAVFFYLIFCFIFRVREIRGLRRQWFIR